MPRRSKNILIFTGGGVAPALNATLYGAITAAQKKGMRIFGGMFGWDSLLAGGNVIDITKLNATSLKNAGGTFLRTSRAHPIKGSGTAQIKKTLKDLEISGVIAIGGDDTLGAAWQLSQKNNLPIVAIPKTVDNDLHETYWTPGFPTAAHTFADFIEKIKYDAAYSMGRIFVIESIGMKAGWLAAAAAYGGADVIVPPEKKVSYRSFINNVSKKFNANGGFAVVVVSQEAHFDKKIKMSFDDQKDSYRTKRQMFIGFGLRDKIKQELGVDTKALYPGTFIQSGPPIPIDQRFAISLGRHAVGLLDDGKFGTMARLQKKGSKIIVSDVSLKKVVVKKGYRSLPANYFNFQTMQPTQKFFQYMKPILGIKK